jgi:nucleotide-binding universal stress UspA family protein
MSIFPTKVLVATDGSREAQLAAQTAADLSQKTNSELHVVHVFGIAPVPGWEVDWPVSGSPCSFICRRRG